MTKARWNARESAAEPPKCRPTARCLRSRAERAASASRPSRSTSRPRWHRNRAHGRGARRRHLGILGAAVARHQRPDWRRTPSTGADGEAGIAENLSATNADVGDGLLKVVSTGFLVDEETALMWRGLMLTKAVEQFLRDVQLGRARLPPDRHAPGHRRRPNGPGADAAEHRAPRRHHPRTGRAKGGAARCRHGPPELS